MKNKILVFIIGVLVGAILATGGFYIYENSKATDEQTKIEDRRGMKGNFDGQTPPDMQNGGNSTDSSSTSKPTRPNGGKSNTSSDSNSSSTDNQSTPPEKPADDNNAPQANTTESNT